MSLISRSRSDSLDLTRSSKVREALISFSEKVHHYSGIMDVLVSHHPEYVALAYGAIKFLFVGVVNHQKLLTQLCTGLSNVANILPRAALVMRLYATSQIRTNILAIYANSKAMHMLHAITRPAELRYNDLLATISSLSQSLTENALDSSHAEQRDMHTDITTLVRWKPHIDTKIDQLMTHILKVKKHIIAEQATNSSARLNVSQKLSESQLPIKAFQNYSDKSFLIMINGTRKLLRDSKLPYLIQQAIKVNENIHTDAALAPRFRAHLRTKTEEDWVKVLASDLQGIPLVYIVLDVEVLSQSLGLANSFWPSAFFELFNELSARGVRTVIRVVLYRDLVVTVSDRKQIGRSTARTAFRNQATSTPAEGGSVNLEAIADSQQTRGRVNRPSHRRRRVR
ncbi:hypothetical protein F4801DRAFT_586999 [Xylaria longipes]|nr:hypothetical protein F4801DRAFT_586999 [Xylaria longipes]